jgi:hypothetical protein
VELPRPKYQVSGIRAGDVIFDTGEMIAKRQSTGNYLLRFPLALLLAAPIPHPEPNNGARTTGATT